VNNLHPVAIIVAVLFFGGIWGLWGVFFAIPLATMLKAVFSAWPVKNRRALVSEEQVGQQVDHKA
jgi:putative permease